MSVEFQTIASPMSSARSQAAGGGSSSSADEVEISSSTRGDFGATTTTAKFVAKSIAQQQAARADKGAGEPVASPEAVYLWYKIMWLSFLAVILAIVGLSVPWYFIRIVSAPMSIGNATVAPTAGASSQVTYEFSLTQITATSINARSVRNFDQYVLPNVDATLTGVRAAVIIGLVAALFAGLNYLLLSQGWLQSTLSFEVAKQWYRMQVPSLLTAFAFAGALASVLVLLALPPAFGTDDVLIQLNNPAGGAVIPLQSGLSCAASKAIIDCSLLFEANAQTLVGSQYNVVHRPLAGWFVMIAAALLTMYVMSQAWAGRRVLHAHALEALAFEEQCAAAERAADSLA